MDQRNIITCHGNIFNDVYPGDVIVVPTNTVGAMGAGMARVVRDTWPLVYNRYRKVCQRNEHTPLNPLFYKLGEKDPRFLLIPTKDHWGAPSTPKDIIAALLAFVNWSHRAPDPYSIRLPLLGGGNGQVHHDGQVRTKVPNYTREELISWHLTVLKQINLRHTVYFYL